MKRLWIVDCKLKQIYIEMQITKGPKNLRTNRKLKIQNPDACQIGEKNTAHLCFKSYLQLSYKNNQKQCVQTQAYCLVLIV